MKRILSNEFCLLATFLALFGVGFFHIPFALDSNVLDLIQRYKDDFTIARWSKEYLFIWGFSILCFAVFFVKKKLDATFTTRIYTFVSTLLANLAFFFLWLINFAFIIAFHCTYYWAFDCRNDPEHTPCLNAFPPEIDTAYLFFILPSFFIQILILGYGFYSKILTRTNCFILIWLLVISAISVLICFRGNGIGCFD